MRLEIDGMHCDACVRRVRQALLRTGQCKVEEVTIGSAHIAAAPDAAPVLLAALAKAGFPALVQQS